MSTRAKAFYDRLIQLNYLKGHVYHTTTKARIMQAKFFLEHLNGECSLETPVYLDEFDKRDMFIFGLVNSLRSSLDSFTHEIVLFYEGSPKRRDIHFRNLLNSPKISITLPNELRERIQIFQDGTAFPYLNKLRNAMQHRSYVLVQTRSSTLTGFNPESDLRLPENPEAEPGEGRYESGRVLFGALRYLYDETRDFVLSSYELATRIQSI
jgi:hypothetical protein